MRKRERERKQQKATKRLKKELHLIINGVKLGKNDTINKPRVGHVGMVGQRLVKLGQLVHSLVPHQSLPHKQNQVWLVNFYQFR